MVGVFFRFAESGFRRKKIVFALIGKDYLLVFKFVVKKCKQNQTLIFWSKLINVSKYRTNEKVSKSARNVVG